jgi:hypothetical protein
MIVDVDEDGNGGVEFDEFLKMMVRLLDFNFIILDAGRSYWGHGRNFVALI